MEFNTDLIQTLVVGATGGIPTTVLLVQTVKGVSDRIAQVAKDLIGLKETIERFSTRLQKLEVTFEVIFQSEMKRVTENQARLDARLQQLETAVNRLSS